MKDKPGNHVRILTDDDVYEGIIMPRPEIFDNGYLVLKLDNGYNIGVKKARINEIKVLQKPKPKEKARKQIKKDPGLADVSILSTGGTISSRIDYHTGGVVADYDAEDFVDMCPELSGIANISARKVIEVMSEDMNIKHWQKLSKAIIQELKSADGIVITTGTDMLHYTSAALSFFLQDLNKPVIVTGSQRSIDRGSSDAFMNLICSVRAAAEYDLSGVVTCLHATTDDDYCYLIRGTKVRKMHTSRRDAFRPVNEKPLAKVYVDGKMEKVIDHKCRNDNKPKLVDGFEEKTAMVYVYPGMDPGIIDYYIQKGYKGIVIVGTALGHVPTMGDISLLPGMKKAIDKGIALVIASQTLYGRTHPYVYTNLRKLSVELGCQFSQDILPEVAYIKLGWMLGNGMDIKRFDENFRDEVNSRHPDVFLE